ncbi:MAG: hypothetical protein KJO59_10410 [Ignavibacteria bacterium]|nr:hypothetical protein [Ignavibacteria bacterium]
MINANAIIWVAMVILSILIEAHIPYTSAKVTSGWLSIFAYPKLYGAVVLWGLFLSASGKKFADKAQVIV